MLYITILISSFMGLLSIYIGIKVYQEFNNLVHSNTPVSVTRIFKISGWTGLVGFFLTYALFSIAPTIFEKYDNWTFEQISNLLIISIITAGFIFLFTLYRVFMAVRDRNSLIEKYTKKKE